MTPTKVISKLTPTKILTETVESSEPELDKRLNFTIAYIDSKIPGKSSLYWKPIIDIINQVDKSIQLEPDLLYKLICAYGN